MKNNFSIILLFMSIQIYTQNQKVKDFLKTNYIISELHNDFNNDGLKDDLYIFASNTEKETKVTIEDMNKRKLLIIFNRNNNNSVYYENDNIFPCRECTGKSDNDISDLKFEKNILSYKTIIAPFSSNNYSIINFKLKFINQSFEICNYEETYYKVGEDNHAIIRLDSGDIPKMKFNYYDWVANKSWDDYILVTSQNVTKLNDFAYKIESVNPSVLINVLLKIIKKYPERVVAYLNLADGYWETGDKLKAKENYKKYIALMKSQNKDLKRIPQLVWERAK
ncbi:hypothetical protein VUJ46_19100 [Chryseobacterium sp. MYb264]|uniref:tetratricopeptide repeat protein n=1 Tax=Chryseobacterium sp. MYb264 TaxID=2745153 RepID=UPI002E0E16F5|nr:hypothetical protein VUJ46_19100 [Chryseobacterium sp. MYb264]